MGGGFFAVGWGDGAELGYGSGNGFEREGDFGFGGVAAEAEAKAGLSFVLREADGG